MKHCFYNETVGFFYNNSRKELTTYWRTKDVLVVALGLTVTADLFAGIAYMFLMFHTGPRTAELSLKTWFIRQSLLDTSLTRHQTVFTMQLHSKMSNQRVMILIFCIWVTALLLGLIPSYGWHCLCALEKCSSMAPLYSRSYLTFWAISNLVIFLIMVVGAVWRLHASSMQGKRKNPAGTCFFFFSLTGVLLFPGAFVICWTPGQVVLLLDGLGCKSCNVLAVEKYVLLLAEINSLINAIVYSYRDNEMRSTFRRILCFICYRNSKYTPTVHRSLQFYSSLPKQSCLVFPKRVLFGLCSTLFRRRILLKASSERNLFELLPEKQIPAFRSVCY
uniref:Lysophosphatidic acid receptor 2 n=1 Tax=Anas platyrhynchos TaxID=8839 RepID=A0A8B9R031_ANAPL